MKKSTIAFLSFLFSAPFLFAQSDYFAREKFTEADTLRGMLRPERTCFDVTFYDLNLKVDIEKKYLAGYVDIHFDAVENFRTLQLDLFDNMQIHQITFHGNPLEYERRHHAVFVKMPLELPQGSSAALRVEYSGHPIAANRAPWDGGFDWKTDKLGRPWVGVACEGTGASLWWPNKDHLSDEPDSVAINITVPSELICASNGNLREKKQLPNHKTEWKWFVSCPINNYNVSINIGHYSHFSDIYISEKKDTLALDYYVLDYNLEKAKNHFEQVKPMLACYENIFGKYPFWEDGFSMIETPYLGMEHQSGIAYGNKYMRGYLGTMIPKDMDWDYIIIHESGHEYFGNSVSVTDHADMWIHESFTTYMEALYVECKFGYEDYLRYLDGQLSLIKNQKPMVGPRDVNFENFESSDHYFKGSWVIHTFRHALGDDELFFKFLHDYYEAFKMKVTSTEEFLFFVKNYFEKDWSAFWGQYLFYPDIPVLKYSMEERENNLIVKYKWKANVEHFDMPVFFHDGKQLIKVYPSTKTTQKLILENAKKSEVLAGTPYFLISVE